MAIEITTPVGRIVWGHPTKQKPKLDNKRQPVIGADGQPRQVRSFGVAFDKATFQNVIWPALAAEAATAYPQGVPPAFSWKYVDGDGVDREGKAFNQREGYAGCYVLAVSTELPNPPPIFKLNGGAYQQMPAEAIKCGDFVAVGLNIKVNVPTDRTQTPGLYINPLAIEFVGYGTEIISQGSADPMALFKGAQHQLPPGASATPVGAPAGAPGMPGMGMQQPAPGYPAPAPAGMPGYPAPGAPAGYPAPAPAAAPGYPPQQPGYPAPAPAAAPGYPPQQPGMPGMMPPR